MSLSNTLINSSALVVVLVSPNVLKYYKCFRTIKEDSLCTSMGLNIFRGIKMEFCDEFCVIHASTSTSIWISWRNWFNNSRRNPCCDAHPHHSWFLNWQKTTKGSPKIKCAETSLQKTKLIDLVLQICKY